MDNLDKSVSKQNLSKIALKNSSYNFLSLIFLKFGGLIFTIIIARILLPELFGIYALALSLITLAVTFTNLGIDQTFTRYFSEALGKTNKKQARSFYKYFLKVKYYLIVLVTLGIFSISKWLSYSFYDKPLLFHALLFGCLLLVADSIRNFIATLFVGKKDIKPIPFLELVHQISRILFSVLAILILQDSLKVPGLFLALSLAGLVHLFLMRLLMQKKDKSIFKGKKVKIDKSRIWSYLGFMSIATISLAFFTSIDTLMLGKFVDAEYLGFYRAALSLVLTFSSFFSLSGILLPIFTQIHDKRFERGFQKTIRALLIFAIPAGVGTIFIAKYLIYTIYGGEYLPATLPLYFLTALILTGPLITLYNTIFQSKEKPRLVAYATIISLVINVILNFALITFFLRFGQEYAILGAAIATLTSRLFLLGILALTARQNFNLKLRGLGTKGPIFATLVMALFLMTYNYFIDINLIYGIIEIVSAIIIYFSVLILVKGVKKEDLDLVKSLIKK